MKSVLVTGASSGIGAATARHLASLGWRVFGTSRRERADPGIEWVALDVCEDASVDAGLARVRERLAEEGAGGLDALVCNAGFGIFGSIEEVSIDEARAQLETNFFGVLRCVRGVLPAMREAGRGRIVVVGSLAGRAAIPFQAHYSASKAAVDSLCMALANEVAPFGVHVSLVEPGDIDTAFNDAMDWGDHAGSPYGARLERCEAVIRESLPKAPGPDVVARAVTRALTARRPRLRYPVGPDSWLVPIGRRLLPDRATLRLIASHFGI